MCSDLTTASAVLFDLDGTLIDSVYAISAAVNCLRAERGGIPIEPLLVRPWVSLRAAEMVQRALGPLSQEPESDLSAFRDHYRSLSPESCQPYPFALEALKELQRDGITLGLCTNKPQGLTKWVLSSVGMAPLFSAVVAGMTPPKPHPAPILKTLELLGAAAGQSVFVGDSETDAEAAAAAGVRFILVDFGYPAGPLDAIRCDARIGSFTGLLPALRRLRAIPAEAVS